MTVFRLLHFVVGAALRSKVTLGRRWIMEWDIISWVLAGIVLVAQTILGVILVRNHRALLETKTVQADLAARSKFTKDAVERSCAAHLMAGPGSWRDLPPKERMAFRKAMMEIIYEMDAASVQLPTRH